MPAPSPSVGLGTTRAAVVHAAQQVIRILDDLVAAFAFDVRDEADAAAVVLELRADTTPCAGGRPVRVASRMLAVLMLQERARRIGARARLGAPRRCEFRVCRSCSHGSRQRSAVWLR